MTEISLHGPRALPVLPFSEAADPNSFELRRAEAKLWLSQQIRASAELIPFCCLGQSYIPLSVSIPSLTPAR